MNNNPEYKYVEIETGTSLKEKNKNLGKSILLIALLTQVFGFLSMFAFITLIGSLLKGDKSLFTSFNISILIVLIASLLGVLLLYKFNKNKKTKETVRVNINDKNLCINCGTEFNIENNKCPNCNYSSNFYFECQDCHITNNVHRIKCIKCGSAITKEEKKKFITKFLITYFIYLVLIIYGMIMFRDLIPFIIFLIFILIICLKKIYECIIISKKIK